MTWYVKGISVLERAINVPSTGASSSDKEAIIRIQTKMMKSLEMAKERLQVLGIM